LCFLKPIRDSEGGRRPAVEVEEEEEEEEEVEEPAAGSSYRVGFRSKENS